MDGSRIIGIDEIYFYERLNKFYFAWKVGNNFYDLKTGNNVSQLSGIQKLFEFLRYAEDNCPIYKLSESKQIAHYFKNDISWIEDISDGKDNVRTYKGVAYCRIGNMVQPAKLIKIQNFVNIHRELLK